MISVLAVVLVVDLVTVKKRKVVFVFRVSDRSNWY